MNCREFEDIVNDLARAKMIEAASRAAGLAHAEVCGRCAARLADERALSAGLKSLAESDERESAPASVEAVLLEAFRAQASNPAPIQSRRWLRRALAVAAAILIAFGFIVYRAIQNKPQKGNEALMARTPTPAPSVKPEGRIVKENAEPEPRRALRGLRPHRAKRPRSDKPVIIDSVTAYAEESEYATDFIPLTYGGDQKSLERGQVIRVQMPRSALIAFGLPVNVERADSPVKADLVLGEDGMAQAIRFVR